PLKQFNSIDNVWGLIGFVRLLSGYYLIVISKRELVGRLDDEHDIYRITGARILPFSLNAQNLEQTLASDEALYVAMLERMLTTGVFHYCTTLDLTQTKQRAAETPVASGTTQPIEAMWRRTDTRFHWNHYLQTALRELAGAGVPVDEYMVPVVNGFFEVRQTVINGTSLTFGLFSRRNRFRAGTRFFSRGIDDTGNVSNYVETEQFISLRDSQGVWQHQAYVQTRGSIPVRWAQIVNLKYTPRLHVPPADSQTLKWGRMHFEEQKRLYGPQVLVSLINSHGYEKPMGEAYGQLVEELHDDALHYVPFDFHKECSKMRWHRISLLMDAIEGDLSSERWYAGTVTQEGLQVQERQVGIVRTNCMDCLDRTNVVQSAIGRLILGRQLRSLGILHPDQEITSDVAFEYMFRNVWADNADAVSMAYSGTGALKTDFTRTGKRSHAGALQDLRNSVVRYFKNNYYDGHRQDTYDIFLGNFTPTISHPSPWKAEPTVVSILIPRILAFLGLLLLWQIFFFYESPSFFRTLTYVTILLALVALAIQVALGRSDEFVDWPRLVQL
ncbi:SacI homology domain-containing protein, partial [Piptocephalis cylindrospora]